MEEKSRKRREWVKTAAIVFLSVMLVLTFFSQTIMNYSLPIVAAQYVNSGSITAKVRGTGIIEAADPYNVEISESRVVSSVAVKKGDTVEKDQVLFYLEDKDSEELKEAEKTLDEMLLSFKKALLSGDISNSVINNAQNGVESSTAAYQAKITAAQNQCDALEAQVASLEKQKELLSAGNNPDSGDISEVQKRLDSAKAALDAAQANLNGITGQMTCQDISEATAALGEAELRYKDNVEDEINKSSAKVEDARIKKEALEAYNMVLDKDGATDEEKAKALQDAKKACSTITNEPDMEKLTEGNARDFLGVAVANYQAADAYHEKMKAETWKTYTDDLKEARRQVDLFTERDMASAAVISAQTAYNGVLNEYNSAVKGQNAGTAIENIEKQLIEARAAKKQADDYLAQLLTDVSKELELGDQNRKIADQRELVEELREKSVGAEIKAPVAGTVSSLNIVAGETTNPENPLAVIQPDGKGFSLSFSVTADQAKKLTPGDPAEVQNAWYYDEISATLAQIRNDPENPGQNKLLVFDIQGDVMGGQSLSLSVGQKSANYDLIVPNSAIREDNNGKFILTVESKSSPLGNRYIATRVDVEVLASDDTQSAVSGALYGYEYVITTSTKPVEAGKQVRLSDN